MSSIDSPENSYCKFRDILSDEDLKKLFDKFDVKDGRNRKLSVFNFFWLMILSAAELGNRGSLLLLIGFYLGSVIIPFKVVLILLKIYDFLVSFSWHIQSSIEETQGSHQFKKFKIS